MAKTKKIEKDFQLSDSTVNCYGFRLLTEGYLIDEYKRNPIGYYMHDRENGVVVRWEDLRIEGDRILGKPVVNLSNERGQQCVDEVEGGFLNGASVGHIVALQWSEDPKDMLPGQTGPTVTKWYNRECSFCDVPGNMNSLALFDKEGKMINLSDFKTTNQNLNMKDIKLTAVQLTKLNLTDTATEADVNTKLDSLFAEAAKVPQLTLDLTAANSAKKLAEDALTALKASTVKESVKNLLDEAVKVPAKITNELRAILEIQYADKPVELKAILDTMKPFESLTDKTVKNTDAETAELAALMAMSGEDLYQKNKFDRLKELSAPGFKTKYKEYFEADPPEDKK